MNEETTVESVSVDSQKVESRENVGGANLKQIFDQTTIAFPDFKPMVEASVVEDEDEIDHGLSIEAEKIFDDTTIAFPISEPSTASAVTTTTDPKKDENGLLIETTTGGGKLKPRFWAVVLAQLA